jgi:hypothetical protein
VRGKLGYFFPSMLELEKKNNATAFAPTIRRKRIKFCEFFGEKREKMSEAIA